MSYPEYKLFLKKLNTSILNALSLFTYCIKTSIFIYLKLFTKMHYHKAEMSCIRRIVTIL